MSKPSVFIALPHRPGEGMPYILHAALSSRGTEHTEHPESGGVCSSLLTTNFNDLWCRALNSRPRPSHFLMVHSDVGPLGNGWVDTMLRELDKAKADVLSIVMPLKNGEGVTSTGIMRASDNKIRKLSLRETLACPTTFDAAAAGYPGSTLLINTGLWVCRFDPRWVEKIVFRIHDTILKDVNGKFMPAAVGEDFLFSIDAQRLGLRVVASHCIQATHVGRFDYPNFGAWGAVDGDKTWYHAWNTDPPASWQQTKTLKIA